MQFKRIIKILILSAFFIISLNSLYAFDLPQKTTPLKKLQVYTKVGTVNYVLYKNHLIIFVPQFEIGTSFFMLKNLEIRNNYRFLGGYKYIINGKPYKFFLEDLVVDFNLHYLPSKYWKLNAFLNTDFNFRYFYSNTFISPGIGISHPFMVMDYLWLGLGFKSEIFPGNNFKNTFIPFLTIQVNISKKSSFSFFTSYEGEFGIRLNDYYRRYIDTSKNTVQHRFESIPELNPFFNFYGNKLYLNFQFSNNFLIQYHVENRFYFYQRKGGLAFSKYESLRSMKFVLDFIYKFSFSKFQNKGAKK